MNVRGELPDYIVKRIRRDRTGVYAGTVMRFFEVGPTNQRVDLSWLDPRNAPVPWDIPCIGTSADINPPMCAVTYDYEGISDENPPIENEEVTFEIDASMSEDPIETHPAFLTRLKDKYGWDENERRFSEFIQSAETSTFAGHALSGKPVERKNPLFGVDSWLSVGAVYRRSYASTTIPPGIFRGIGTIVPRPPDIGQFNLPDTGSRDWLKMAPKVTKTGNAVRITEEWMLSGFDGWREPIYNAQQLGDRGGADDAEA